MNQPTDLPPSSRSARLVQTVRAKAATRTPWQLARDSAAFTLSAILSPYLVIPLGTLFVIVSRSGNMSKRQAAMWTLASVFWSTFVPAAYVLVQIKRGVLNDVHVMERERRGGVFAVAIASCALGTALLWAFGAPVAVWALGLVLAINGIVLVVITAKFKISMHVAVLSSTVLAALIIVPSIGWWKLAWLIPALIWARVTRGRHTLWQGISGAMVSGALTFAVLKVLEPRL